MAGSRQRKSSVDHSVQDRIVSLIASIFLAVPTAGFLWFFTNTKLAIWGSGGEFVGTQGFWIVVSIFCAVAIVFPNAFPSFLSKVWYGILRVDRWL